jgi:hypothetical protein
MADIRPEDANFRRRAINASINRRGRPLPAPPVWALSRPAEREVSMQVTNRRHQVLLGSSVLHQAARRTRLIAQDEDERSDRSVVRPKLVHATTVRYRISRIQITSYSEEFECGVTHVTWSTNLILPPPGRGRDDEFRVCPIGTLNRHQHFMGG